MTHNNLLQNFNWESTYEDSQHNQNTRQRDEVISIYEIYVKDEDNVVPEGRTDSSIISGLGSASGNQLIQSDCVIELDETLETELIRPLTTTTETLATASAADILIEKLCYDKEPIKYKILDRINDDNKLVPFSQTSLATTQLVDKDDPRSRLHFVKYLKREGKTLKIWECGICSKEFRHQYTLMRHLPTHTDERNFKCETCGKAFRQLSTLSQHRAIHSDARPYVCEYCKKTFNRVSTLISHRKTHSDDKPHKCQICGKGFHQKGNLRNHVFTHTNERPYKCALCGKGFNQMSNLMCHKLKSHAHIAKSLPYACSVCGKEFLRRFALRSHEEHKHGIKYSQARSNVAANSSNEDGITQENSDNIVVDAIQTKAMEDAVTLGQTPFALYKPAKGIPILVKVSSVCNGKQILSPATPDDLKLAGKMCLSPLTMTNDQEGMKAVQIKVPVVATVTQTLDADGNSKLIVEPPEPDQDRESQIIDTQYSCTEVNMGIENENDTRSNSLARDDVAGATVCCSSSSTCTDLMGLGNESQVQYIRATEDGRYEMMTNSEAIDLMSQNCHDVRILDDVDVAAMSLDDHIVIDRNNSSIINNNRFEKIHNHKNIEVFGDKDFRILGSRDDRINVNVDVDDISLLEQSKIDDFILGSSRNNVRNDQQVGAVVVNEDAVNGGCNFSSVIDSNSSTFRNHVIDPNDFAIFNNNRRFFH